MVADLSASSREGRFPSEHHRTTFGSTAAGWGGQPVTLAAQVDDPASLLSRHLDTALPDVAVMHGPLVRALDGAVTIRPPGSGRRR
ncbi:hypothetical protein [Pseudofrankia sp. BMG5.37]|uniref:hypothetical protein n=1 Tax=Pseudofrankia sp. BMG5.37 TaxID=3050035 RepID=UPI002895BE6C|nr:hypothetical protein [Pseudofrankia sp. BMG5.37]MDT3446780.1 hypothetical protein [Pseudofrankia sp. BMG5.37]